MASVIRCQECGSAVPIEKGMAGTVVACNRCRARFLANPGYIEEGVPEMPVESEAELSRLVRLDSYRRSRGGWVVTVCVLLGVILTVLLGVASYRWLLLPATQQRARERILEAFARDVKEVGYALEKMKEEKSALSAAELVEKKTAHIRELRKEWMDIGKVSQQELDRLNQLFTREASEIRAQRGKINEALRGLQLAREAKSRLRDALEDFGYVTMDFAIIVDPSIVK